MAFILIAITLGIGFFFRDKQKKGAIGGTMAASKTFWLSFTIFSWFILPIYFLTGDKSTSFKITIMTLSVSMWIRGIIELVMLYKYKNWRPIYGIVHDIFTFAIMLGALLLTLPNNKMEMFYLSSLLVSLCFETYYAYFFHKHMGGKTEGDDAIWFANKEDPIYKRNLQVTTFGNILLYACLFVFISY